MRHGAGDLQRALAQIGRCVGFAAQHCEHVARFERRTDAAAHGLGAVGDDRLHSEADGATGVHQAMAQCLRGLAAAHLGGLAHRDVDDDVARSGRNLLRQHRGDQLALAVEVERALDADQDVVRRTQAHRAAPDDAAAFALHHPAHGRDVQFDSGERLHHVRGACRRGDGARRGLGHGEAEGRDDRHHDQGRAIARQTADAVLVHHRRAPPGKALAGVDHGARERDRFGEVQPVAGAGGEKGR